MKDEEGDGSSSAEVGGVGDKVGTKRYYVSLSFVVGENEICKVKYGTAGTTAANNSSWGGGREGSSNLFHIYSSVCFTLLKHSTYKLILLANHNNLSPVS